MSDMAMCRNEICDQRKGCVRSPASGTKPHDRQVWASFSKDDYPRADGTCAYFWPVEDTAHDRS